MSLLTPRGGIPIVRRVTTSTTGASTRVPGPINFLKARNLDATNAIKLYFSKADFDADSNYVTVPIAAAANPFGEWSGPVELGLPQTAFEDIWWKSVAATPILELVMFVRHG